MGRIDETTKRQRLEAVWALVRRHPLGILESEIAQTLNLPRRTVNNYLRELETEGRLYKDGRYWCPLDWDETRLRPVELSPEEALSLYLGARLLSKQMDRRHAATESALLKLANALRNDAGLGDAIVQAVEVLASRPEDAHRRSVFREVVRGYIYRHKVRLRYKPLNWNRPFETTFATYLIEPSLIGSSLYLIGHSSRPNALRAYKLDRIQEATLTKETYHIPTDFDGLQALHRAWNIMLGEEQVKVVLRFSPRVRERVLETIWHPSQQVGEDPEREGWLRWEAYITHILDILPWVRSWGADVEALEPPELARALRQEARRLMHLYFPDPRPRPPHLYLWAKARRDDFHPLLYHLLDVGACAEALWKVALTPAARAQLAHDLGLSEEEVRRLVVFLAAVHDIGKAAPAFQTKVPALREALRAQGYDFPEAAENGTPHSVISAWMLRRWFQEMWSWPRRAARHLAYAVGAHHGLWPLSRQVSALRDLRKDDLGNAPLWEHARRTLLESVAQVFSPPTQVEMPKAPEVVNRVVTLLAGFVTVADWLGSMETFFPYEDRIFTAEEYLPQARRQAREAVEDTGWLHAWQATGEIWPFERLFDFDAPRPFQAEGLRLAREVAHPALVIVEAPTGQGKTELALALADAWLQGQGGRGLYLAMPTQATSNAMHRRLRRFVERRYPEQQSRVVLAHSRAQDVLESPKGVGDDRLEETARAAAWFLPRKRALLASFGVGTVDQALVGALQARHHYLRLFGLAHKVVVFDEVHAYDTYMETLFLRLLAWLRAVGASVIVLSATLPRRTREAMLRAWTSAPLPPQEPAYPRLTIATPQGVQSHALPAPADRTVALGWLDARDPDALADWLVDRLAQGGCAAVICNTVNRAQEVYAAVRERFPEDERLLFHARMPFAWRVDIEEEVLNRFGNAQNAQRPRRFVLVATQVIEQSLDLDFDLMVSELAPVDLLIQRAGRLHRHVHPRPVGLEEPQLWILRPQGDLAAPTFGPSRYVYAPYILWRTYLALAPRQALRLPADTDALMRAVYAPWAEGQADSILDGLPEEARCAAAAGLAEAWQKWEAQTGDRARKAELRVLPKVNEVPLTTEDVETRLEDDEEALKHPDLKALTRLIVPGVTLLPLHRQPDGRLTLEPDGGLEVSLEARPTRPHAREMRRYLVQVHHQGLLHSPGLPAPPSAWQRVAGLRGVVPLVLEDGEAHIGPWRLRLDREFGLRLEDTRKEVP